MRFLPSSGTSLTLHDRTSCVPPSSFEISSVSPIPSACFARGARQHGPAQRVPLPIPRGGRREAQGKAGRRACSHLKDRGELVEAILAFPCDA